MNTYEVTVTRGHGVWVVDITGLPSSAFPMTQVAGFADLDSETRDLIAGLLDRDPAEFNLTWRVLFGDTDVTSLLAELEGSEKVLRTIEDQRRELRSALIRAGRQAGLSQGVLGEVLGMSQQRVAQLNQAS